MSGAIREKLFFIWALCFASITGAPLGETESLSEFSNQTLDKLCIQSEQSQIPFLNCFAYLSSGGRTSGFILQGKECLHFYRDPKYTSELFQYF